MWLPGARRTRPMSACFGFHWTACHLELSVAREDRLSACLSPAGYALRHTRPGLALTRSDYQGVFGLSQTLVMSAAPILGWKATAVEPALCVRALE